MYRVLLLLIDGLQEEKTSSVQDWVLAAGGELCSAKANLTVSPYRAVNTLRLCYKNQSVNLV
jgi:hypothetical protein